MKISSCIENRNCFDVCLSLPDLKRESRSSGDEDDDDDSVSERDSVFEDEEGEMDEEEDVSVLSSLENYQLCLKYQQVWVLNWIRFTAFFKFVIIVLFINFGG